MHIHDAVTLAYRDHLSMRRKTFPEGLHIFPTNGDACCIILSDGGRIAPRWNPTADDLTADDWIVEGANV